MTTFDHHIDYDALAQEASRGIVRTVLTKVGRTGLPGEHHFYIAFDTRAPGAGLSKRLREKYPEEMTIVLQHRFWDLIVTEDRFEVVLTFNGIREHLVVPFASIRVFYDPSVPFGLQFGDPRGAERTSSEDDGTERHAMLVGSDGAPASDGQGGIGRAGPRVRERGQSRALRSIGRSEAESTGDKPAAAAREGSPPGDPSEAATGEPRADKTPRQRERPPAARRSRGDNVEAPGPTEPTTKSDRARSSRDMRIEERRAETGETLSVPAKNEELAAPPGGDEDMPEKVVRLDAFRKR